MWSWFGGGSAQARKDSPKNAILNLRSQLDMLQKREKHLQNQIDEQQDIARKNATSNKNGKDRDCAVALFVPPPLSIHDAGHMARWATRG
jgi:hypothetical protein